MTLIHSTSSSVIGRTEPRLWTQPLTELNENTSYGFDLIRFCEDVLELELDPWQQWLAIHSGELLPNGHPRFRRVLTLVARQNGKTTFGRALVMYWMFVERQRLILMTSNNRGYVKETWEQIIKESEKNPYLSKRLAETHKRLTTGEEDFYTKDGSHLKFAASNGNAGRSKTINRLLMDELREHRDYSAINAAKYAMQAVPDAQLFAITNQGDDTSIVLNDIRNAALDGADQRLGIFEWSSADGLDFDSPEAIVSSNPSVGIRIRLEDIQGDARQAITTGGEALSGFRTEALCQRVLILDPAIDETAWNACEGEINLLEADNVHLCLDISPMQDHATLVAAAMIDGITHVDVVKDWKGYGCTKDVRRELKGLVEMVKPQTFSWFPTGPTAALAASLRQDGWTPRGVEVTEIKSDSAAVCMGLAEQVKAREVRHSGDPLLQAHVCKAERRRMGDAWIFTRAGQGSVDGAYAVAGAVHLARTQKPRRNLVISRG